VLLIQALSPAPLTGLADRTYFLKEVLQHAERICLRADASWPGGGRVPPPLSAALALRAEGGSVRANDHNLVTTGTFPC
jgi:hypothetical protein